MVFLLIKSGVNPSPERIYCALDSAVCASISFSLCWIMTILSPLAFGLFSSSLNSLKIFGGKILEQLLSFGVGFQDHVEGGFIGSSDFLLDEQNLEMLVVLKHLFEFVSGERVHEAGFSDSVTPD